MTKSEIQDKQICLLRIIFEVEAAGINFEKLLGTVSKTLLLFRKP